MKTAKNLELLHAVLDDCQVGGAVGILHLQSLLSFNYPATQ